MCDNPVELTLFAWMELPYLVEVPYTGNVELALFGKTIAAQVRFRNDLLRIDTANEWTNPPLAGAEPGGLGESWIDPTTTDFRFAPRYCSKEEIEAVAKRLNLAGAPYVHASETQTVVEVTGKVQGRLPLDPWDTMFEHLPIPFFWHLRSSHMSHALWMPTEFQQFHCSATQSTLFLRHL